MAIKDSNTEQLIKDTAKRIFFAEGKLHATTQDIADAAGVSRTSLHYYFRSRDLLLKQVFNDALTGLTKQLYALMEAEMDFKEKIRQLIDLFLTETIAFPYREIFLITEMLDGDADIYVQKEKGASKMAAFLKQIEAEMEMGTISKMDPTQFMMNIMALNSHPLVMRPLHKQMFNLTDAEYMKKMDERKKIICDLILK
ncbi:TetR/AcrR family transcriptional regulator [Mucilaginibacter pedocola]|uniref:TetR family transcriptional regulator n=1 Tax=Mucilaginibacter pedocola TaxID=1792845 RepID=A0A1S9PKZ3_9SPHI|nr:TetR/AcrR family transcriptional regulator [Mucilaginibacter pedocola]OOQ61617.1 TetR family transcriptional regulator [Mucilaginibacter pedocola]